MQTKTKLLNRRRINQKLENIFLYPLSIVHAPIGYGKTTAVSQFLNQYAGTADLVWVSLAGSGGSVEYLWNHLVENIQGSDLRHTLKKMGYPYDELKRANLVDLLIDYEYKRPAVLVLDDFQVINDPGVFALIKLVVQEHIKNMHIVLITRDLSKLDAAGLYQKQLCFTLTEKSLKFTGEEIQRYFNMAVASMLGGWMLRYGHTHAGHSVAHILGARCGIPHGYACAYALPWVLEFNAPALPEKTAAVGRMFGCSFTGAETPQQAGMAVRQAVIAFRDETLRLRPISGFAERPDDGMLDWMAAEIEMELFQAFNPRRMKKEDARIILENIFS